MRDTMTAKERWLAAIHMQPVDRLPFWPKLGGNYPQAREAPFNTMDLDAIHDWVGSDKHTWIGSGLKEVRKNTAVRTSRDNGTMQTVYETPYGEMRALQRFDAPSSAWHPMEFPVKTAEDIMRMKAVFEDVTFEVDEDGLQQASHRSAQLGESALTASGIGETPLMNWVEWLAGIENSHYLLMDHRAEVENMFDALQNMLVKKTRLMCEHSPADVFYLVENTSTTLISPAQYQQYCVKHVGAIAGIVRDAGKNLVLHMCGHLKALLPDLARIPAHAFEAFTTPTLGNTTLRDGRTACPDKCLIGGTNAMLWTHSEAEIIADIRGELDALPHHRGIVITSAGVMPPVCSPQTIKAVGDWVKQYPANMTA